MNLLTTLKNKAQGAAVRGSALIGGMASSALSFAADGTTTSKSLFTADQVKEVSDTVDANLVIAKFVLAGIAVAWGLAMLSGFTKNKDLWYVPVAMIVIAYFLNDIWAWVFTNIIS